MKTLLLIMILQIHALGCLMEQKHRLYTCRSPYSAIETYMYGAMQCYALYYWIIANLDYYFYWSLFQRGTQSKHGNVLKSNFPTHHSLSQHCSLAFPMFRLASIKKNAIVDMRCVSPENSKRSFFNIFFYRTGEKLKHYLQLR